MKTEKQSNIKIIDNKYQLNYKIDEGAFGQIYRAINKDNKKQYAVKIEKIKCEHPQLIIQCKLYNFLHSSSSIVDKGIPRVFYCGVVQDQYNVLVMELMGPSLQTFFRKTSSRKFSLKTVFMLIIQMIDRVQFLHENNILHRDIKPDNFCLGPSPHKNKKLYLLDLGLAKKFIDKNGHHVPFKEGKSLTGTVRYASVNTHLGKQQSRRDDMESIAYVCLYLLRGELPWQVMKDVKNKQQRYERIKKKKLATTAEQLCKGQPSQFVSYLNMIKKLRFEEKPSYDLYKSMFKKSMKEHHLEYDGEYDWTSPAPTIEEKRQFMRKLKLEDQEIHKHKNHSSAKNKDKDYY